MTAMLSPRIFSLPDMSMQSWELRDGVLAITAHCRRHSAPCSDCGLFSTRVHGCYQRQIKDLPCQGHRVRLEIDVRRFRCTNASCRRCTFAESLPIARHHQRRSQRLQAVHAQVGLALGGSPGADLLQHLGMQVSGDTLLRTLHRVTAEMALPEPKVLHGEIGIDDWAYRRGRRYGTIIVDLAQRRPIELLPDRQASTVAAWLVRHPEVRVVTRDRAGAYAEAVRQGAPAAIQVADRWHLLKNLGDAVERLLTRHQAALRDTMRQLLPAGAPVSGTDSDTKTAVDKGSPLPQQHRACRLACYEEVVRLHQRGVNISTIAHTQQLDRKTVRAWLCAGAFPERMPRPSVGSKLDPHRAYLHQRWQDGCRNGSRLLVEIVEQGYRGRASILRELLAQWRHAALPAITSCTVPPSPCRVRAWMMGTVYRSTHSADYGRQFMECLCRSYPVLDEGRRLANEFAEMVKKHHPCDLAGWLKKAKASGIRELRGFANGLERDLDAVLAALTTSYSNGIVEGHINRLKMIKRQMYGRAGLALLRIRVLHRPQPP